MPMRSRAAYLVLLAAFAAAGQSGAAGESPPPVTAPMELLAEADLALDSGQLDRARSLYERIAGEYPDSPEAHAARRALTAMQLASTRPLGSDRFGASAHLLERRPENELEKTPITTWDKLDFTFTAFLYGAGVGIAHATAIRRPDAATLILPPIVTSFAYAAWATSLLFFFPLDRGDLPLVLGVTGYVPLATYLALLALWPNPDLEAVSLLTAGAGTAALPLAALLAMTSALDPGDTQLTRDAGFWGMALTLTGALALAAPGARPSAQLISTLAMIGLFGGLGTGLLLAVNTRVTPERVRVTTWGGYGGALLGSVVAAIASPGLGVWPGTFVGSLLGLTIAFSATWAIDEIPATTPLRVGRGLSPAVIPLSDGNGSSGAALGLTGPL